MKKFVLLTIITLASSSGFSQTIILNEKQAKAVAKDIVEGRACREELEATINLLELTETKLKLKDKLVFNLEDQKQEFQYKDMLRTEQLDSKDKIISDTEKLLKKSERKTTLYKVIALAGAIGSGILLLK